MAPCFIDTLYLFYVDETRPCSVGCACCDHVKRGQLPVPWTAVLASSEEGGHYHRRS